MNYYHLRPILCFNEEEIKTLLKHKKIKITPSIPNNAILEVEGDKPRICFVKENNNNNNKECEQEILKCLRALISTKKDYINSHDILAEFKYRGNKNKLINFFIFKYSKEENMILPPDVSDFRLNNEHWLLKEDELELMGYLSLKDLLENKKINIINFTEENYFSDNQNLIFSEIEEKRKEYLKENNYFYIKKDENLNIKQKRFKI